MGGTDYSHHGDILIRGTEDIGKIEKVVSLVAEMTAANFSLDRRHVEKRPTTLNLCSPVAVGEEPIMSNTMEPVRQHMEQEAANELARG